MRRITYLLTALLLSFSTRGFAQLEELDHQAISVGALTETEIVPNQWYGIICTGKATSTYSGGYIWDVCYYYSEYYFDYDYYGEEEAAPLYMSFYAEDLDDGMVANDVADIMIRFVPTGEKVSYSDLVDNELGIPSEYDTYYMQFGTGNYIWVPDGQQDVLWGVIDIEEATPVFVYNFNGQEGHFGICRAGENYVAGSNVTAGDTWCFNHNGPGGTIITYYTDISFGRGNANWTLYPVSLYEISEHDEALQQLGTVYSQYIGYYDYFTVGTTYGCYDADAVAAFQAALDAVAAVLDNPDALDNITIEEMEEMGQAIQDTYSAVVDSRIPLDMSMAEGYYLFTSAMEFSETSAETEDPETGEVIPGETTHPIKGMYSEQDTDGTIYGLWKDAERTCPFLWKVTDLGDKQYSIVNMATDATFNTVIRSTSVTMTQEETVPMSFDFYKVDEDTGDTVLFIRRSDQTSQYYLHCGGHDNGAGVSGNLVGWGGTDASSWKYEIVSEEEAQAMIEAYAPTKEAGERYREAMALIEDAEPKMVIAIDAVGTDGLITSVEQLSSPCTDPNEGEGNEISALIDGDTSTFWQSNWHEDDIEVGTHYFQVELVDEVTADLVFTFTRRSGQSANCITLWGVYGSTSASESVDKDQCTLLAEISTPFGGAGETLTSESFSTQGFTVLRFYIEETNSSNFFSHLAEFQLYEYDENKDNTQRVAMGSVFTDLEAAIAAVEEEGTLLSVDTYNTLKAAYDAFIAVFVDPTELRATIAEANAASGTLKIGTNPGYWSDESSKTTLLSTVSDAKAYDASGVYTQTQSDTYVETLLSQINGITEAAIKVQTGKWYQIRYATVAEIEENGWSLSNGAASETSYELYGKYMAVANSVDEDGVHVVDPLRESDLVELCAGSGIYFEDKDEIQYDDYAKFRFISVGDTAYTMQNKATGLFLKAASASGYVTLSPHPTLFDVTAIGYGENLLAARTLDGDSQNNLHAQLEYNVLVTWSTSTAGSNSGLFIEDIGEAVASDYDGTSFNMSIQYGKLYTCCYPVSIAPVEGTVYGVYVDDTTITLAPLEGNVAEAGEPFVYVLGDLNSFEEGEEEEPIPFTHGYDIAQEAQSEGKLIGSYYGGTVGAGKLVASDNSFVVSRSSTSVAANGAYIDGDYSSGDDIVIVVSDETFDGIESAIANSLPEGNIYSIDGKLLGKGNVSTVKSFGKGIYIVNGVKVAVK